MPITVSINSGKEFEILSEGTPAGVLADIVDLGIKETQYGMKHKVRFVWLTDEVDGDGKTKRAFETFTKSLHEKATLRKRVDNIVGKGLDGVPGKGVVDLTPKGEEYNLEQLLGVQRRLVIQHNENGKGDTYANVTSTLPPEKKLNIPKDFQRKPSEA